MNRLGINTLGDLVKRTADELLESKNFGMTSLTEVARSSRALGAGCGEMNGGRRQAEARANRCTHRSLHFGAAEEDDMTDHGKESCN